LAHVAEPYGVLFLSGSVISFPSRGARAQRHDNSGKIERDARENGPILIGAMRNGR
jgi:hypothetical protein